MTFLEIIFSLAIFGIIWLMSFSTTSFICASYSILVFSFILLRSTQKYFDDGYLRTVSQLFFIAIYILLCVWGFKYITIQDFFFLSKEYLKFFIISFLFISGLPLFIFLIKKSFKEIPPYLKNSSFEILLCFFIVSFFLIDFIFINAELKNTIYFNGKYGFIIFPIILGIIGSIYTRIPKNPLIKISIYIISIFIFYRMLTDYQYSKNTKFFLGYLEANIFNGLIVLILMLKQLLKDLSKN